MRKLLIFIMITSGLFYSLSTDKPPSPQPAQAQVIENKQAAKPEPTPPPVQETAKPTYNIAGGCEQYRSEVSKYAGWDVRIMLAIMHKESLSNEGLPAGSLAVPCNYLAHGDRNITFVDADGVTRGMSCGLGQVRVLRGRPDCATLQDPVKNIEWMHRVWQGQGYNAWSVYSKGLYRAHLTQY